MLLYHYSTTTAQHNSPSIGSHEDTARSDVLLGGGGGGGGEEQQPPRSPKPRQSASTEVKRSKTRRKALAKHSKTSSTSTSTTNNGSKLAKLVGEELRSSVAKPATWASTLANYNRTVNSLRSDTFDDLTRMVWKVEEEAAAAAAKRRAEDGDTRPQQRHIRTMPEVTKMDAM